MNRTIFSVALLLGACGGSGGSGQDLSMAVDLVSTGDLATADLRGAGDLATPDMATPPDMAPPMLSNVPSGCAAGVTAQTLYNNIVKGSCAISNCHAADGTSNHYSIASAADLKTKWVNVNADQPDSQFPYVTPNNPDRSYVIYKLLGQQAKVSSTGGTKMPKNGQLTDDQICQFVSWIQAGAN